MTDKSRPDPHVSRLIQAALLETACVILGLIASYLTGHGVWILTGILAGLGFSLPAVIRFIRESREQDRASR